MLHILCNFLGFQIPLNFVPAEEEFVREEEKEEDGIEELVCSILRQSLLSRPCCCCLYGQGIVLFAVEIRQPNDRPWTIMANSNHRSRMVCCASP